MSKFEIGVTAFYSSYDLGDSYERMVCPGAHALTLFTVRHCDMSGRRHYVSINLIKSHRQGRILTSFINALSFCTSERWLVDGKCKNYPLAFDQELLSLRLAIFRTQSVVESRNISCINYPPTPVPSSIL